MKVGDSMAIKAADSSGIEEVSFPDKVGFLRTVSGRLLLWKNGLSVLRDWKIYAEFLAPASQQLNVARLQHLESLGLDLTRKSVLEIGAAVGEHSLFYLCRNCRVLPVEGRPTLARKLSERLGIEVKVLDVDREPERLEQLGRFDLVHCYGLLYHLSNPGGLLSCLARVADCLLLETCVSKDDGFGISPTPEIKYLPSQALNGRGCRPTRQWAFRTLRELYPYVYATRTQPRHPDFPIDWTVRNSNGHRLTRAVFIASHSRISNPNLVSELPWKHEPW